MTPALLETVAPQLEGPLHWIVQSLPPQDTGPPHEPLPEQITVAVSPEAATEDAHESTPLQVTVQVLPPQ